MPILEIILRQMKRSGIEEVILTVGHLDELMKAFLGDGERLGLNISYSWRSNPYSDINSVNVQTLNKRLCKL